MKKLERLPQKILEAEKAAITQFVVSRTLPDESVRTPMGELFKDYRSWRAKTRRGNSRLTVDGFGRLFPKTYKRATSYWAPGKGTFKCVMGLVIKE